MSSIVFIHGSPRERSRTDAVLSHIDRRLRMAGHQCVPVILRDLPAAELLSGDASAEQIAKAVAAVADADAIVLGTPVYKAAYSGLTKLFLDLLPQEAFRGKQVLPVVTGGSPAHVLALDYALRPVLTSLGADHVGQGWFVLAEHVQLFDDGGVLLDPKASGPLLDITQAFLAHLDPTIAEPIRPRLSDDDVHIHVVEPDDPTLRPLLADLTVEYGTRYNRPSPNTRLTEVPTDDFTSANRGAFVVVTQGGETVAGGAIRQFNAETAEIKRVWTSPRHRRKGLARRVLTELETTASGLGYRRIYLTTGPRQPEARGLYLAAGYTPNFDLTADPEALGPLPFTKPLADAVGVDQPTRLDSRRLTTPSVPGQARADLVRVRKWA